MKYILSQFVKTAFEETITRLKKELRNENFIVLKEIDLKNVLNKRLLEIGNYKILVFYDPLVAYEGLIADKDAGVMFPFNLVIRELKNRRIRICIINYSIAMRLFSEKDMITVASSTMNKLKRIFSKL